MPKWVLADGEQAAAINDIDGASDRAAAIIAGSLVETRLTEAIKLHLLKIKSETIEKSLFRPSGPLGTFSTKIDLAFLMGILTERAYKELVTIKDVRNKFAHHIDIVDFRSHHIMDKCVNLTYATDLLLSDISLSFVEGNKDFIILLDGDDKIKLGSLGAHKTFSESIRGRFIVSCQTYSIYLHSFSLEIPAV